METFKIGICEPNDFSDEAILILKTIGEVELFDTRKKHMEDFVKDKDAIFVRLKYQIDDKFIKNCQRLKYICSPTTGLNHISVTDTGINIISLKNEVDFLKTIRATPEHIFGLTIGLLRNYSHAFLNENNKLFDRELYKGYEIYGNSVGIIGLGRIGSILVDYFSAFGASIKYTDVKKVVNTLAEYCNSAEDVIEKSNIIILTASYCENNREMIGYDLLKKMQGKFFINAARGELVDECALLELIKKNAFKGVAIDVISEETYRRDVLEELLVCSKEKNIIITPHIGGATYTSMRRTEEFIAKKLVKRVGVNSV